MKFKDWFLELNPDLIEVSPFKCIGWCQKYFFYVDEDCPAEKLIEDIKNGWGPADFDIVEIDFCEDMWVITCNDGKCDVTTEWCKEKMKKDRQKGKEFYEKHKEEFEESYDPFFLNDLSKKEMDVLYELLLHADEVHMLGKGPLCKLFKDVQKASWKNKQQF